MPETKYHAHLDSPLRAYISQKSKHSFVTGFLYMHAQKSDALVLILIPNSSPGEDSFMNGKFLRSLMHIFNWPILLMETKGI